jgi:hypothetical protein
MANNQRFSLWGMTYLLSTPSSFSAFVDGNGDVDAWLAEAGVADPLARHACATFVDQLKNDKDVYNAMQTLRSKLLGPFSKMTGAYDGPGCPNGRDAAEIVKSMAKITP